MLSDTPSGTEKGCGNLVRQRVFLCKGSHTGDYSKTSSLYRLEAIKWGIGKTSCHHLPEAGEEKEANRRGTSVLYLDEYIA